MFKEKVQGILTNGYELNISEVINNSFDIVRKNLMISILFAFMFVVLMSLLSFLMFTIVGVDVVAIYNDYMEVAKQEDVERVVGFIESLSELNLKFILGSIITQVLLAPLYIGLINYIKKSNNGNASFGSIFEPYKSPKTGGIFVCFAVLLIMYQLGASLFFFPGVYFYSSLFLAPIIYWFNDVSIGDALSSSFSIANKKIMNIIAVVILLNLISGLGLLVCIIGYFITLPLCVIGHYMVYEQIFRKEKDFNEIDSIGND